MAAVMDHNTLITTATTADQVILSVTLSVVTTYKFFSIGSSYTTYSATEANLGLCRIQADLGAGWVQRLEQRYQNTDLDNNCGMTIISLGAGIAYAIGDDIRAICTPASTTSMRWPASFWGNA